MYSKRISTLKMNTLFIFDINSHADGSCGKYYKNGDILEGMVLSRIYAALKLVINVALLL